jgi:peptidoglycan/LPS O-acetylase OafA/YrhL
MFASKTSRYIAPIDGLRAIAVIAVLLYHAGIDWIPGGFLGVDLFFVISGYVITRLILDSIEESSALDLRKFYFARIRRLFPSLLLVIASTSVVVAVWAPDAAKRFFADIPFVLTGSNNWRLVAVHQDYFAAIGRPPLLQHTWSLAVEIQFYLVWPLILLAILKYFGKANIARGALSIATISGLTLFLYSLNVDSASSSRISHIYFGSDTHSLGLFLGSALAVSWVPQNLSRTISQRAQDFVDFIGVFGFLGLLSTFFFIDETNATLYRVAFPLAAIFGCFTLISLVHPASRFAPLITTRPLLWLGKRSYGIYLWHWVIFQVMRPGIDLAGEVWAVNSARILIVIGLADISLRYVEIPIRRGELSIWWRGLKYRTPSVRKRGRTLVAATIVLSCSIIAASSFIAIYRHNHVQNQHIPENVNSGIVNPIMTAAKDGLWVTGDSVILGIRSKLASRFPIALVNARVGRQIQELTDAVAADRSHVMNDTVILDLGNNNRLTRESVVTLFDLLKNQPHIILINTAVPRGWRDENNQIIRSAASNYPQIRLVDWASISAGHPEFFAPDGVHLNDLGSDVYVAAIIDELKAIGTQELLQSA